MGKDELIALAKQIAAARGVEPAVICGICERESSWNPWAIRYEPDFFKKYVAGQFTNFKISATEAYARAFSWGLGQVMGQCARELGYRGELAQLCDPATGLDWLSQEILHKLRVNQGNIAAALLAYNGGSNKDYAKEVLELAAKYK